MRGTRPNPMHTHAKANTGCRTCGAMPGESCRNGRGGIAWPPHKARLDDAVRALPNLAQGETCREEIR